MPQFKHNSDKVLLYPNTIRYSFISCSLLNIVNSKTAESIRGLLMETKVRTTVDKHPIKIIGVWSSYLVDALVGIRTKDVSSEHIDCPKKDNFGRIMQIPFYEFTYKNDNRLLITPYYKVIQSFRDWVEQFKPIWDRSHNKYGKNLAQDCAERMFVKLTERYYTNFLANKTTTFNDAFGKDWFKGRELKE